MLHFDANPIYNLDIWLQSYEEFVDAKNNIKQKELEHCFCQYLKTNIADIRLIPLDHVTFKYSNHALAGHISIGHSELLNETCIMLLQYWQHAT